jgi:hypothetical protein
LDKFEMMIQQLAKMTEKEKMRLVEENKKLCIGEGCPTYNDCARNRKELLFCVLGESQTCITEEVVCICPDCPVTKRMELKHQFFCTRDSENEQRRL